MALAEVHATGSAKLQAVSRAVRAMDDKELKKRFYAGLNRAVKPLKVDAKDSARKRLPQRGGLAKRVARTTISTRRLSSGISLVAKPNAVDDPAAINRGRVKHPTFGHQPSVVQVVKAGWFTGPMAAGAPLVREELVKVLDQVAADIASAG